VFSDRGQRPALLVRMVDSGGQLESLPMHLKCSGSSACGQKC
jgi:hypothetical protein